MTTAKKRPPAWSDEENAALCRLYFDMLDCAMLGASYNKAGMIRSYQASDNGNHPEALAARSKQSIEFKLMNASAAHGALDGNADTMDVYGYRAMPNYQASLKVAMQSAIDTRYDRYNSDEAYAGNAA